MHVILVQIDVPRRELPLLVFEHEVPLLLVLIRHVVLLEHAIRVIRLLRMPQHLRAVRA